jgi:small nuclear ribonucleoprotein (snRNP)-like protein
MFGVGATLEVEVKGSETVRGTIQSIADQEFVVAPQSSAGARHVAYDQLRGLILPQRTYKASGQPNAAEARRVVAGWGVGKKIRVTLADGRQLKGAIPSMDMEHFALLANTPAAATELAYSDVRQIGSGGMSTGMLYAILGGIVAGVVVVVAVVLSQTSG